MVILIQREFVVEAPLEAAWRHLAQVEKWPSWAKHIRRVELSPQGELTPNSRGRFRLTNGIKSEFRMTEWDPPRKWKWVGPFLWLTVHYNHLFEAVNQGHTKMTWIVGVEGFGAAVLGRLFAAIYNRNLNRAIPNLQNAMKPKRT